MKQKVLISTGGSGGHVIPAMIFYEHLKNYYSIHITSDERGSKFINNKFDQLKIINIKPLTKNIIFLPWNILLFIFAIFKSLTYLKKKKIQTVLSTGGYMTLPVCIAAKILGRKLILFEPNKVIGRSNLLMLKISSFIFCYSAEIINFPKKYKNKIKIISPLLRKEIFSEKKIINTKFSDKMKILIIGGSQGADFLQNNLKDTILKLSKKINLEITHQTNKKNELNLKNFYNENNIKFELFNFKENLYQLILKSDLCITRSGASSLAELVQLNTPFIAIPFPYAKDNHQFFNALFYKNLNCCWMLEQNSSVYDELYNLILHISTNKVDLEQKINAMKNISYENSWNIINKKIIEVINEN